MDPERVGEADAGAGTLGIWGALNSLASRTEEADILMKYSRFQTIPS